MVLWLHNNFQLLIQNRVNYSQYFTVIIERIRLEIGRFVAYYILVFDEKYFVQLQSPIPLYRAPYTEMERNNWKISAVSKKTFTICYDEMCYMNSPKVTKSERKITCMERPPKFVFRPISTKKYRIFIYNCLAVGNKKCWTSERFEGGRDYISTFRIVLGTSEEDMLDSSRVDLQLNYNFLFHELTTAHTLCVNSC